MKTILVTGGNGMVGHAFQKIQHEYTYRFVFLSRKDGDLSVFNECKKIFEKYTPNVVIHLAANVGGLYKNMNFKVDMFESNIQINLNVLKCCHLFDVEKLVSCLSTCIFPDQTEYPITEKDLHNGPPHFSNDAYAYAKRMLDVHSCAYFQQYGKKFVSVIPTNIYGEHDNYHLEDAHVIPALIHKCYLSKKEGKDFVVFGSGKPLRQFIYSVDLAKLMMWCVENYDDVVPIILSPNESDEVSIGEVARQIARCFDYEDRISFDTSRSDGQYKKTASNQKLIDLYGEYKFTTLSDGISKSVEWFQQNYNILRK